jgi:hypothetical protein
LSHSASPLICIELEQIAFLILIFVRRDCDAGKIAAECCKLLTVGTRETVSLARRAYLLMARKAEHRDLSKGVSARRH